ncbi:MAG: SAM-dependent methyltransferase [Brachymonas sp.]|nr:SAM-dependent methyltransferase [Brachymonas sp.]
MKKGALYLVPAPLDFGCDAPLPPVTDVLPLATLQHMAQLPYWVCENAKTLRALLKRVDAVQPLAQPLQSLQIAEIPRAWHKKGDHQGAPDMTVARTLLAPALQGHDMALASEAGMPAVADPGASLVRAAHLLDIAVVPLVGPSSILLALAASGLNGQNFAFHGYLPQDMEARASRLRQLEQTTYASGASQWWIETPYRNTALLHHALQVLKPTTLLCVGSGLTLPQSDIHTRPVKDWRAITRANGLEKLPAVFGLSRP